VVARGGLDIPASRMFQMDASAKVNTLNAYVSGVGASKRVVVWDTTIQKMTQDQILFVFGHEMGHYVLNHVWILVTASCAGILLFLYLGFHVTRWALEKWKDRWAIRGMADWASLPALLLAVSLFALFSEPLANSFSRVLEHNADIYGLEVTHGLVPDSAQTAAQAFQILGEVDLSDPDPSAFIKFWLYNHPALTERVQFAAQYDPWGKGEAPKYVK
jgi:Zn-dependent protease with chaperone function